tara:strand:- start:60 stop:326 length:267 start_codon:yes stop_codon:yes gene_type:complete
MTIVKRHFRKVGRRRVLIKKHRRNTKRRSKRNFGDSPFTQTNRDNLSKRIHNKSFEEISPRQQSLIDEGIENRDVKKKISWAPFSGWG